MEIRKVKVKNLRPADYNPRQDLQPGDREYDKIANSMDEFGYIDPIVWNERTGNIVDGHQRIKMLPSDPEAEIYVSVVNLSERDEKILNAALNKCEGKQDDAKIIAILNELGDEAYETGFSEMEIQALESNIDDLVDGDFLENELSSIEELFNLQLTFNAQDKADLRAFVKDYGKEELVKVILDKVREGV